MCSTAALRFHIGIPHCLPIVMGHRSLGYHYPSHMGAHCRRPISLHTHTRAGTGNPPPALPPPHTLTYTHIHSFPSTTDSLCACQAIFLKHIDQTASVHTNNRLKGCFSVSKWDRQSCPLSCVLTLSCPLPVQKHLIKPGL